MSPPLLFCISYNCVVLYEGLDRWYDCLPATKHRQLRVTHTLSPSADDIVDVISVHEQPQRIELGPKMCTPLFFPCGIVHDILYDNISIECGHRQHIQNMCYVID